MGEVEVEVWGSDCLPAQLKAKAKRHQLCLAHQLRNLQAVVDRYPDPVVGHRHADLVPSRHPSAPSTDGVTA